MATKSEIQRGMENALARLEKALSDISQAVGEESKTTASITYRRNPEYEHMLRYQMLADWSETLAAKVTAAPQAENEGEQPPTEEGGKKATKVAGK